MTFDGAASGLGVRVAFVRLLVRLAILVVWLGPVAAPGAGQETLRLHFLDVGQGDAILIEAPDGRAVLYDGGPRGAGTADRLEALGIGALELVIASHNHADHIGGLEEVIRRYRPGLYMDNGVPHTTLTYERVLAAVEEAGSRLAEATARTITLGRVRLRIVPPMDGEGRTQNESSIGVRIEFGEFAAFLGGDAEPTQWAWWLEHHADLLGPAHVHKASHHGSVNGDVAEALARLGPSVVVVGVGARNGYGHPHASALALYRDVGARIQRTDREGTLVVEAHADGSFEIRSLRSAPLPDAPPRPFR